MKNLNWQSLSPIEKRVWREFRRKKMLELQIRHGQHNTELYSIANQYANRFIIFLRIKNKTRLFLSRFSNEKLKKIGLHKKA